MKIKQSYILLLLAVLTIGFSSCSTKKNTWATRSYHQTKTKYNIHFNGAIAFQEGQEAIDEANKDDFSSLISLYPVSNHEAAKAAASLLVKPEKPPIFLSPISTLWKAGWNTGSSWTISGGSPFLPLAARQIISMP